MHARIYSASVIGVQAYLVEVEVDLSFGLLNFMIVGLADTAIKESRQRVATALKHCGIKIPERKITINLAPADLKKEGTLFDLPIALGILCAAGLLEISKDFLSQTIVLGELSLDGTIRKVKGVLPIACDMARLGKTRLIVPQENATEASLIYGIEVIGVSTLIDLIAYIKGEKDIQPAASVPLEQKRCSSEGDFADVIGQAQAKRTMQIAAAGQHNILFIGSPGAGKTMLAKRILSIMPPMTFEEILETNKIYSICGKLPDNELVSRRPFRAPHHTISPVGLVGGGSFPQPGEISLAHHGVLFLDEFTEFKKSTIELLRQPLESRQISIARAQYSMNFPSSFLLVAALNPCPCGFFGDRYKKCSCTIQMIVRYLEKLSGPLLDRIDLQVSVPAVDYETIKAAHAGKKESLSSQELYEGVMRARNTQLKRFGSSLMGNAHMLAESVQVHCALTPKAEELVKKAFERMGLSMRGYHKLLKVARTIADIEGIEIIDEAQVTEAIMYRSLDQSFERTIQVKK